MDSSNWAVIIVALISVFSAFLAGRSAKASAKYSGDAAIVNSRTLAETEAYNRARKMDIETIERQDQEIDEIRENSKKLREKVRTLTEENESLRKRVARLEQQLGERSG